MKILVIDDKAEVLKQIESALVSAKGPDGGPYAISTAPDPQDGARLLEQERFDVVVVDMHMGPDGDEGLAILRQLVDKSLATIVLTGYANIPNCVDSMQAGAWDYLEKVPENGSDAYENLLASIHEVWRHRQENPEAARAKGDTAWIHAHMSDLLRDHPGEVVAVLDQKVVGHDKSFDALSKQMKKEFTLGRPTMISIPDTRGETIG